MEEGKKEKKVTVKFFLSQAVEPVMGEGRKKFYPLYVQVTYNRRNMQFKSKYSEYYESLQQVKPSLLKFEERVIRSIVLHEASEMGDEYDLKGLKKKYEIYSTSILEAIEQYLKPKLRLAIQKTGDELINVLSFHEMRSTVPLLHKAAKQLFKDFEAYVPDKLQEELKAYEKYHALYFPLLTYNFPTLIDWVDGSYVIPLEEKLTKADKNNPEILSEVKSLIDSAVKKKRKELEN